MLAEFEQFVVASGKERSSADQYRLVVTLSTISLKAPGHCLMSARLSCSRRALSAALKVAEARGLQVDGSAAAAALKELSGAQWSAHQRSAIGWLEEFWRSREDPEVRLHRAVCSFARAPGCSNGGCGVL